MFEMQGSFESVFLESFSFREFIVCRIARVNWMKTEEIKTLTASIKETSKDYVAATALVASSLAKGSRSTKKLWKSGNKSLLIKAGLALIVFPEPIVSDMLGTALLAAGAVQEGIKRKSIYLDDLPKALRSVMEDLKSAKELIR